MNILEYSIEAEAAKGLFYNKEFTVYVEGDDDVLFWDKLFKTAKVEAYIEEVGGTEEIKKKVRHILKSKASFIVACDSDHSDFIEPVTEHPQIIKTYGYSIENSMFSPKNLEDAIQKLRKSPETVQKEINSWAEEFSNNLYELIIYDVANHVYDKGVQVFGRNCLRFMKNNSSKDVSSKNIKNFIKEIEDKFTKEEIENVKNLVNSSEKELWFHIKGHFITNGVLNVIKHFVKIQTGTKCDLSHDSLYALTIDCSSGWKNRIDIKPVIKKIKKLKAGT